MKIDIPSQLTRGLLALATITVFSCAATLHVQTPNLHAFAREFHSEPERVGWVATFPFLGLLFGTGLLVPLGDAWDKRRIVIAQVALLALVVLAMAAAPTLPALALGALAAGVLASVSQQLVPFVAELAPPAERGRAVGTLLSGLFLGILAGRLAGGVVGAYWGWRWVYAGLFATLAALVPALVIGLPRAPARPHISWSELLVSLARIYRAQLELRRASTIQLIIGICFGAFWATVAEMLASRLGLGSAVAGLIAIPAATGTFVARPAGRWVDRHGTRSVITAGIGLVLASQLVLAFGVFTVVPVVVGAAMLDCGLRAVMVANQALVTRDPETRSRSNTVFAMHIWAGNASGTFLGTRASSLAGWLGVCGCGVVAALVALTVHRRSFSRSGGS